MRVVLDTNVLVSGLLNPFGPPAAIMQMAIRGELVVCHDARILTEYGQVLRRPKFQIHPTEADAVLEQIQARGSLVASQPLAAPLPHPDDEAFLEVAVAGQAEFLITGNLKHYPSRCGGVRVVSPRKFLQEWRGRRDPA
jgi:putative PIN family toxin of toxin-antitoxin system